ncbi:MAG: hypothetical protein HY420_04825 [Candidatus Kerfeldbacteria bacterium]|nr:hypothetical protein [Candidatus Kerfeldbacteria bacterium]
MVTNRANVFRSPTAYLLLALPAVSGGLFHLGLGAVVGHGIQDRWWLVAMLVIGFCATISWAAMAGTFVLARWVPWAVGAAVAVSGFIIGQTLPVWLGVLIEMVAVASFARNARIESTMRIRFSIWKTMTFGITTTITLMLAAVALYTFYGFTRPGADDRIKQLLVGAAVPALNATLPRVLPDYRPDATIDELIRSGLPSGRSIIDNIQFNQGDVTKRAVEEELKNRDLDLGPVDLNKIFTQNRVNTDELAKLIDEQVQKLGNEFVAATRTELSKVLGVELTGSERAEDALRTVLNDRYDQTIGKFKSFMPFIFAGSLFFTLALFSLLYMYLAWFLGLATYWLLRAFHLIVIDEHAVTTHWFRIRQ